MLEQSLSSSSILFSVFFLPQQDDGELKAFRWQTKFWTDLMK